MSYTNANCLFHSSRDFIAEGSLLRLGKQEEYGTRSEPEEGYHLRSPTLTIIRRCSQARGKQVPSLPPVCSGYSTATTTPYLFGSLKETSASLVWAGLATFLIPNYRECFVPYLGRIPSKATRPSSWSILPQYFWPPPTRNKAFDRQHFKVRWIFLTWSLICCNFIWKRSPLGIIALLGQRFSSYTKLCSFWQRSRISKWPGIG